MNKHPDDVEIKNLEYDHYADLAESSERTGDYPNAIQYIVQKLLSPDYRDHRRWEGRLGDILRKWYKEAEEQGDINLQKKVLTDMIALGFTNLAESLAPPELKKELFKNQ
ncbi:hypothetical protein [Sulfidibacter corallicola]|uniref:Uncharacterized protein n=1 Tax=Sulfidibacter corallicola TaxID=2818388 RepID=A0A8A4TC85_SULCO|nr:hypothetical protein [Sulfidibacter corallicola]QTD47546.1 hypothetical protein J3U87_18280 [Sulfidibacter corallicola]